MNRPQLSAPGLSLRTLCSRAITGGSIVLIALLAVPAALLFGLIYLVWTVSDALTARLDRTP